MHPELFSDGMSELSDNVSAVHEPAKSDRQATEGGCQKALKL
jgi:hypothetical protein